MSAQEKKGCAMEIKDNLISRVGMSAELGCGNNLIAFASKRINKHKDYLVNSTRFQGSTWLHDVHWNQMLYNDCTRKLVNESQNIFISLQEKNSENKDSSLSKDEVLFTSHKYRSILSACIINLQKAAETATEESVKDDFTAQSELFYTIELIWNLCEVLFIDVQPGGFVLNSLLEWVRWHSNEANMKAQEAMEFEKPENQPSYWEAIYCYVLIGMSESARKLLKIHADASRDDFLSIDELLRKMPVYHASSSQTIGEFNLRWRFWQDECIRRCKNGEFSSTENLEKICKILCGDKETFVEMSQFCGSWYYLMSSMLLYTDPCVKAYNLHTVAKDCTEIFGGSTTMQDVDYILLAAMEFDITKVLQELCLFPDGWWFVAHLVDLLHHSETATEESVKDDFTAQSELFYTIELIWNLCEVLFIDVQPGGFVLNSLLEWVRWHSNEANMKAQEAMEFEKPENQPSYWEAIYCYVLIGMSESARKLLKIHADASRDDFLSIDELLRKMPVYHASSSQTIGEFNLRWRFWQDECIRRCKNGEFSSTENLEKICKILCGDKETFVEMSQFCGSWYYLMSSMLLYTDPCVKAYNLHTVAKDCTEIFGGSTTMQDVDYILLAAMEFDITKVLQELCLFPDGWWFVAHLVDLLHHSGQLQIQEICYSSKMREFLLNNYASGLMCHKSLWQIGVSYLDNCPQQGRDFLEAYLERIPLDTEAKAWKILHIAEKREMIDLTNSICKLMARRSLRNDQIGSAVMWSVRAKDSTFASYLADRFLEEYAQKGVFSNLDLLDTLGSCMLVSDRLTFLGKYREFHRVYAEEDFKTASNLLVSLLASNLAPKYFWMTLLLDSIPLLEAEDPIMSSQQTNQLLYCLEELIGSKFYNQEVELNNNENTEKISLLRLSLARNLARAFIEEGSL